MKFKRIVSKILACAMVVTTVFTGNVTNANAEGETRVLQPLAMYDFETEDNYKDIQPVTAEGEVSNYAGNIHLGNNGHDSATSFNMPGASQTGVLVEGQHGLKLPQKNLKEYTVSLWMNRQWNSVDSRGGAYVVMSIGTPDKYISLKALDGKNENHLYLYASEKNAEGVVQEVSKGKVDTNGNYYAGWRRFTITQSGNQVKVYVGETGKENTAENIRVTYTTELGDNESSLLGENGSILIGAQQKGGTVVNYCDFDDISVYDVALSADQITELYATGSVTDTRTAGQILDAKGITVSPTDGTLVNGKSMKVQAVLPSGVAAGTEGLNVSYASENEDIAKVAADGTVTTVAPGKTKITATATIGTVSKSASMNLTVKGSPEDVLKDVDEISVSKNITLAVGGEAQVEYELPDGIVADDVGSITYAVLPNETNASVDQTGKVTGKAAGTCQVVTSVTIGSTTKKGTTEVKVLGAADILDAGDITVTPKLKIKGTATAQIDVTYPDGIKKDDVTTTYAVKDNTVATVSNTGLVTGVKAGKTVVTTTVTAGTVKKTKDTNVRVLSTEVDPAVAVEFDLSEAVNGKLEDISNHGNHGVIQGTNCTFGTTEDGEEYVNLGANTYIELPKSIVNNLTTTEKLTIEARFAKSASCGPKAWLFCLGAEQTKKNYLFVSPNFGNPGVLRSGIKSTADDSEILFGTAKQPGNDIFHTVDMVFDEGVVTLYMDGEQIKTTDGKYSIDSGYSVQEDIIALNTTDEILGYIGKSLYPTDGLYQGKLSSFKIYNSAKTPEEIQGGGGYQEAFQQQVNESLTDEKFVENYLGSKNPALDKVAYDLSLPTEINENPVTWSATPAGIITADGSVINDETENKTVTLTATVKSGSMTATKTFTITVLKADRSKLNAAIKDAEDKIESNNYTPASVETLKPILEAAKSPDVKGQKNIDSQTTKLTNAVKKLVLASGDRDPFGKITASCYNTAVTLEPTKTASVFRLPNTLKVDEDVIIEYASSDPTVATVANGVVTAQKKLGTATITTKVKAVFDGSEKEYKTTVNVALNTTVVKVTANATKLAKGKKTNITVVPSDGMKAVGYTVTYTAGKGAVTVNNSGQVTAKKSGTGKVTVKVVSLGQTVKQQDITFTVGEITGKSSVKVKKSITLKVKGIKGKVNWSLDKKSKKLAKISKKGKLTAKKKKGTVTVTAKVNGLTITKKIKIKK